MKSQRGFTTMELLAVFWFALFCACVWGWVWNIVKIAQSGFDVITGIFIARCIGVFVAPLGAVLGFF